MPIRIKKYSQLASFLNGFERGGVFTREEEMVAICGFFIASRIMRCRVNFKFEGRSVAGVDCSEIRAMLVFNGGLVKTAKTTDARLLYGGLLVSKLTEEEIRVTSQYLLCGKHHLFPHEAKRARGKIRLLKQAVTLNIPLEVSFLIG